MIKNHVDVTVVIEAVQVNSSRGQSRKTYSEHLTHFDDCVSISTNVDSKNWARSEFLASLCAWQ